MTHICISQLSRLVPSHYLNQCWPIVNWTRSKKFQWNFNQNSIFSLTKMHFKPSPAKRAVILSRPQCVYYLAAWPQWCGCSNRLLLHACQMKVHPTDPWLLLFFHQTPSQNQAFRHPQDHEPRNDSVIWWNIWVRSRNCSCLVTWFCYQLIAKPGNKTATDPWPDPYKETLPSMEILFICLSFSLCINEEGHHWLA